MQSPFFIDLIKKNNLFCHTDIKYYVADKYIFSKICFQSQVHTSDSLDLWWLNIVMFRI